MWVLRDEHPSLGCFLQCVDRSALGKLRVNRVWVADIEIVAASESSALPLQIITFYNIEGLSQHLLFISIISHATIPLKR